MGRKVGVAVRVGANVLKLSTQHNMRTPSLPQPPPSPPTSIGNPGSAPRNSKMVKSHSIIYSYELVSTHELLMSTHELLVPAHELLVSTHELLVSTHELLVSTHELLVSTRELLVSTDELLCQLTQCQVELLPSTHELLVSTHELLVSTRDLLVLTRELLTVGPAVGAARCWWKAFSAGVRPTLRGRRAAATWWSG